MDLLFELRDAGNTILIIEHDLDVIRLADWIVELGPEGGQGGGEIVFQGEGIEFCQAAVARRKVCYRRIVNLQPSIRLIEFSETRSYAR